MKRIIRFFAIAIAASAAMLSCTPEEDLRDRLEVEPAVEELQFAGKGNEDVVLTINTNVRMWEATAKKWVKLTQDGNQLIVNVDDDWELTEKRSSDLTITAGTAEPVVIKVWQDDGWVDALSAPTDPVYFLATGSAPKEINVTVRAVSWTYEANYGDAGTEWFTVAQDTEVNTLTITPVDNTTSNDYSGSITLTAGTAEPVVIPVMQMAKGKNILAVDREAMTFEWLDNDVEQVEVETTASDWNAEVVYNEGSNWLETETAGNLLKISVYSRNAAEDARTAVVRITADGADPVEVAVTQEGKPEKNKNNIVVIDCSKENPLNVLELKYVDEDLFFQSVVLSSSSKASELYVDESGVRVNIGSVVQLYLNAADDYIEPLQRAGIKVYLELKGNTTTGAWLSNMKESTAKQIAADIVDIMQQYGLDGVYLEDKVLRNSSAPSNYPDWLYPASDAYKNKLYYSQFVYYLHNAFETEITNKDMYIAIHQANSEVLPDVDGHQAGEFVDYVIGILDWGGKTTGADDMGLAPEQCSAINQSTKNASPSLSNAEKWRDDPYKWFGWNGFDLNSTGTNFIWKAGTSSNKRGTYGYVCGLARIVINLDIQAPTGYYKPNETTRYEDYEFEIRDDWYEYYWE